MACLIITSTEQSGKHFHLTDRTMIAGRDPARDIQLVDPKVSRRHFQIRKENDRYILFEMKSANGVYINGRRIEGEYTLDDGDRIVVGDTVLTYYEQDVPDRTDAVQKHRQADRSLRDNQTLLD